MRHIRESWNTFVAYPKASVIRSVANSVDLVDGMWDGYFLMNFHLRIGLAVLNVGLDIPHRSAQ
jgi:hypothetical protein